MKKFIFSLTIIAIAACSGCFSSLSLYSLREMNDDKTLFVGVSPDMEPIIYKHGSDILGIEAKFAQAMADALEMELRFIELPREKQIDALEQGSIDIIMSGMTITTSRYKVVDFCKPYMQVGQLAIYHKSRAREFRFPQTIIALPHVIGVKSGSTAETFATAKYRKSTVKRFRSDEDAIKRLASGKIDLVITSAPAAWNLVMRYKTYDITIMPKPLTKEQLAWAVAKGNTPLFDRVNEIHEAWSVDGTIRNVIQEQFSYISGGN